MNLPNKLTVLRIIMVPFFVFFMLTDVVHRKPHENTKEALLGYARKYSRNKFAAAIRNVGLLNKK